MHPDLDFDILGLFWSSNFTIFGPQEAYMWHNSCDIGSFRARTNVCSHLCSYWTFYAWFLVKIRDFRCIQTSSLRFWAYFGAQISLFLDHMRHICDITHVILVVSVLEQTYVATYAVIEPFMRGSWWKFAILDASRRRVCDFGLILELRFHYFWTTWGIYVTLLMWYW